MIDGQLKQQNQLLTCNICHNKCKHTRELPCCHKIICRSCLKVQIESHDVCPFCGIRLKKQKPLCKIHHKPLDYYCENCSQYLCSDCLFEQLQSTDGQHSNHKIIEASKVANSSKTLKSAKPEESRPLDDLENHLKSLKSYSELLDKHLANLQKQKNSIPTRKFNTLYQSRQYFESLRHDIDKMYTERQQGCKKISAFLEEQMIKLQSIIEESELILTSNDSKLVPSAQANIEKIKQICKESIPSIPEPPSLIFPNKLCPPLESFKVTIPNFKKRLQNIKNSADENDFIFSEEKTLFKYLWRAKIFPNGTQAGKGTHLAVYVELLKGEQNPTSFAYQVEIISQSSKHSNVTRRYTSVFQPMDSWGWNKIISINSLLSGYLDEDGALSLIISLSPSSYSFCIQMNKEEYNRISMECKQLKKDIEKIKKRKMKDLVVDDNENTTPNEI